eukprot:542448-Prymnesium_polylepis.1
MGDLNYRVDLNIDVHGAPPLEQAMSSATTVASSASDGEPPPPHGRARPTAPGRGAVALPRPGHFGAAAWR